MTNIWKHIFYRYIHYRYDLFDETWLDGQQADFDKRVEEIESFKRKIKYYKSQENKSYRLLDEVEELVEVINQWEIISPLLDKIGSIGTELEEIISEQLVPKFNKIEMESDKNQVFRSSRTNILPMRLPLIPTHQRPMVTYRALGQWRIKVIYFSIQPGLRILSNYKMNTKILNLTWW